MTPQEVSTYAAVGAMRDGRPLQIRAFRREDRELFKSAATRIGPKTIYRRFFAPKRTFTEQERAFFLNVDFDTHVALVALTDEGGRPTLVGSGRYFVVKPGVAEVAFTVIDAYQGQGIGTVLLDHLVIIARATGLRTLTAEVLAENSPMLEVFAHSGLPMTTTRAGNVVHVDLQL